jgi:hypothetical protein
MERIEYRGAPWRARRVAPSLARLLERRDTLIELSHGAPPPAVVLGVPHHAAAGIEWIAERRPEGRRVADENAVLYALVCFARLESHAIPCRLVIAAHATDHDPNKLPGSPYCTRILAAPRAQLLLECHAAGRTAPHELEISAGGNGYADPLHFGRLLAQCLGPGHQVASQARPGSRAAQVVASGRPARQSRLRYPALRTRSLTEAALHGIAALHLEAMPRFRTHSIGSLRLPDAGRQLGYALADAIRSYLDPPR